MTLYLNSSGFRAGFQTHLCWLRDLSTHVTLCVKMQISVPTPIRLTDKSFIMYRKQT